MPSGVPAVGLYVDCMKYNYFSLPGYSLAESSRCQGSLRNNSVWIAVVDVTIEQSLNRGIDIVYQISTGMYTESASSK